MVRDLVVFRLSRRASKTTGIPAVQSQAEEAEGSTWTPLARRQVLDTRVPHQLTHMPLLSTVINNHIRLKILMLSHNIISRRKTSSQLTASKEDGAKAHHHQDQVMEDHHHLADTMSSSKEAGLTVHHRSREAGLRGLISKEVGLIRRSSSSGQDGAMGHHRDRHMVDMVNTLVEVTMEAIKT